jgi:cytoskeleton protein RodZ
MADSEQPGAAPAASSQSLGQLLREARVAKELTIDQLATGLRIDARQISALEEDRFEQIGVPVFVKGYIRQCAQRLGLDPHALIEIYGRQTRLSEVEVRPSKPIRLRDERQLTVWVVGLLVLLLIAVGVAAWWLNGANFEIGTTPAAAPAARTEPAPPPAPAAIAEPVAEPPAQPEEVTSEPAPENAVPAQPGDIGAAVVPAAAGNAATLALAAVSRSGVRPVALDVTFDGESWAEIIDARGQRLFFELASQGKHVVLNGEPPIAVTFGNGSVVRLLVDGERYSIPTQGGQGKLVRFSIASDKE